MINKQLIELVIFDCDGILVDTEQLANRVFIEEVTKLGFYLTPEEAWEHFPGSRFATCVDYVEQTNNKKLPSEFTEIYRAKSAAVFASEVQAIPGVASILESLSAPKAVASNGPKHTIISNLTTAGLIQYFHSDHLFSAYEIQKWKPEPDMHLKVADTFGLHPSKCIVLEDSVPGAQAALSAGMQVIGFHHDNRNQKIKALDIPLIAHMEELIDLLPMKKTSHSLSFL